MRIATAYNRWWVVLVSMLAMVVGPGPLLGYTFGVFLDSIATDLGLTRANLSFAYSCSVLGTALVAPFIGKLIDRLGCRAFALRAAWLSCAAIASLAWLPRSAALVYIWFFGIGVATASFGPIVFARMICAWFDARRGLALGLTLAGAGLGTALVPVIGHWLLEMVGWRQAYFCLAALSLCIAFPILALGFREPELARRDIGRGTSEHAATGYTPREAFKRLEFRFLFLVIFVSSASILGTTVHLIPLLTDRGILSANAAQIASVVGIAMIFGRVCSGYLADRYFAPRVMAGVLATASVGILILVNATSGPLLIVGAACLGFGMGAELDLVAYLVSRYFGLRSFAELYAYIFMGYVFGTASGPLIIGISFGETGSYHAALTVFAILIMLTATVLMRFRPYPDFASSQPVTSPTLESSERAEACAD